ncbi:hypothetical protein CB1_002472002 [Camelus ferus]|nr:hypothetical protein CB1_002472002 [Camelus ferus]
MDGKQLVKQDPKSSDDTQHSPRNLILTSLQETGFIEYMDQGPWYLAFYNDGKKMEQVFVLTTAIDSCPVLCGGNGEYEKGHCVCRNGWKGPECDVPEEQCIDPTCFGHGTCIMGVCICVPGYKGEICEEANGIGPTQGTTVPELLLETVFMRTAWTQCVPAMASVLKENATALLVGEESTVKLHFLYVKSSAQDTGLFFWTLERAAAIPSGQDLTAQQITFRYPSLLSKAHRKLFRISISSSSSTSASCIDKCPLLLK